MKNFNKIKQRVYNPILKLNLEWEEDMDALVNPLGLGFYCLRKPRKEIGVELDRNLIFRELSYLQGVGEKKLKLLDQKLQAYNYGTEENPFILFYYEFLPEKFMIFGPYKHWKQQLRQLLYAIQ